MSLLYLRFDLHIIHARNRFLVYLPHARLVEQCSYKCLELFNMWIRHFVLHFFHESVLLLTLTGQEICETNN